MEHAGTKKNSEWQGIRYEEYCLSLREWALYAAQGIFFAAVLAYVFYRSWLVFCLMLPSAVFVPLYMRKVLKKRRLEKLQAQFKDAILVLASCLNAGYSVENAFGAALEEVARVYGEESLMAAELRLILHKLHMNRPLEEAFRDLADRSGLEDVGNFADIFLAARQSGGELTKIIAGTAQIISEKLQIQEEILTMTAARRLEQKIMSGIPIVIVVYIQVSSPGFFEILYGTMMGRILMTACLGIYLFACWMSDRILEIEV